MLLIQRSAQQRCRRITRRTKAANLHINHSAIASTMSVQRRARAHSRDPNGALLEVPTVS
jgi:hypothetical protein